jgi:hypothetical protein
MTDGRSVSMSRCRAHSGTCDQIILLVWRLLHESWCLGSIGHPLLREDSSEICSVITQWSESRRTRNHTLLSLEPPPNWRARFPYLYLAGSGWPSFTPKTLGFICWTVCAMLEISYNVFSKCVYVRVEIEFVKNVDSIPEVTLRVQSIFKTQTYLITFF